MRGPGYFVGLLGWPLDHTLSPAIHNAAFRRLGLDWTYYAWPVPPESLEAAIGGIRALGAMGANVTMPHKEAVIDQLDEVSGDAQAVGAVNTIQRYGDVLIGHNTDVDGFSSFLESDAGVEAAGARALVLGSGGAARAVVKALDSLGAEEVIVAARDLERGDEVRVIAGRARAEAAPWGRAVRLVPEMDFVVNATPLGMEGDDPLPGAIFRPGQLVVDLVYSPPASPLVRRARAAGADAWGGLGMLVHQAAASFRIWTGTDPSLETMSAAALRAIGQRGPHADGE